jgi:hypothetical protein
MGSASLTHPTLAKSCSTIATTERRNAGLPKCFGATGQLPKQNICASPIAFTLIINSFNVFNILSC